MTESLLEGDIRKQLIRLCAPLLIGNVLQQLYNTVDSLIIGRFLGTNAFSAVGIAGTIMNLFIFVLTGFCSGVSIIMGQMYGSDNRAGFRREVFVSLCLGAGITAALSALSMLLLRPVLQLINSPDVLIPYIEDYLKVIIGGMLATYFYNLFSGILRAIGDTRASTFFLFVAVTVNAALDYVFVGPLGMGIAGAAWATVLSQILSAVCCLIYMLRRDRDLICTRGDCSFDGALVRKTLVFGFGAALHQSSLYIGKIFVQGAVNTLGTDGIAAYTATMRIEGFANSFGTSFGQAVSVHISQNYGARRGDRVKDGMRQSMLLALAMGIVISAALYFTAHPGVRIFLNDSEKNAVAYGVSYLRQIAFAYLMCFTGNAFVGWFRGTGHIYIPLIATTMHITVRACLSYLWVGSLGLRAVALATGAGWLLMSLFQISFYLRLRGRIPSEKA